MIRTDKSQQELDATGFMVLQLLDRLIHAGADIARAQKAKAAVLRDHAVGQINCPTRHYYIQSAKELEQQGNGQDGQTS